MASSRQISANRRNGKLSRGPKTKKGKEISSQNSLLHGLLSCESVLPFEDGVHFRALHVELALALAPVGELERLLVDRIIGLFWRLRRLCKVEAGLFAYQRMVFALDRESQAE